VLPFIIALAADIADQNNKVVETLERVSERVTHIVDIIRTQRASNQTSMTWKKYRLAANNLEYGKITSRSDRQKGHTYRCQLRKRAPRDSSSGESISSDVSESSQKFN